MYCGHTSERPWERGPPVSSVGLSDIYTTPGVKQEAWPRGSSRNSEGHVSPALLSPSPHSIPLHPLMLTLSPLARTKPLFLSSSFALLPCFKQWDSVGYLSISVLLVTVPALASLLLCHDPRPALTSAPCTCPHFPLLLSPGKAQPSPVKPGSFLSMPLLRTNIWHTAHITAHWSHLF